MRDKQGYIMTIKVSSHSEDRIALNIYVSNITSKYIKQKGIQLKNKWKNPQLEQKMLICFSR